MDTRRGARPTRARLPGGAPPRMRALGAVDVDAVAGLVGRCSDRCLRNRFFGYVRSPAGSLAGQLLGALVAGAAFGAYDGGLVAVATGLPTEPDRAGGRSPWELGVLVADGWQRRGLGTGLADLVVAAASARGVTVVAHVERANPGSVRMVAGLHSRYGDLVRVEPQ